MRKNIYHKYLMVLLFLFPLYQIFSAENYRASVRTYMVLPEDKSLITLGEVINDSILLELKIAGFDAPNSRIEKELLIIDDMLSSAEESGSQFIIIDSYELNNDQITFRIECYEAEKKEQLISIEKEEQIGFFLDSAINESMTEVIKKINENIPENREVIQEKPEEQQFIPEIITEDENSLYEEDNNQILLSAALSPFMTTGKAGKYFTHGWEFYLYGGYPLKISNFDFYGGIFLLANKFSSEGVLISSDNTFLTFGPEARILFSLSEQLTFFTDAALGTTVFMMKSDIEDTRSTMFPYFSFGGGVEKQVSRLWKGYVHLRYSFYFEQSVLITGFSPALGVNIKI